MRVRKRSTLQRTAFHGVCLPTTLEEMGSDQHRAFLTRLCSACRLSQPLDALLLPKPSRLCFAPVTPLGFIPSEVFPPTRPTEPLGLPSLLDVAVGRLVWNTTTVQARRLPDDSGARSTGRRAESVSVSSVRSVPGPESPDSSLAASSDNRSIASWQHFRLSLLDWPAIAGGPADPRSPSTLPPESVSRHDRSRHPCKHERFPNGPFRRFVPPVYAPHGKPRVALPFGSRRLLCPFRRHRLMRRSSSSGSTRCLWSFRFGTGLPPEGDLLAPPLLSRRQVGGLAPRKRDVRPSVSVGQGRPLMASTCCKVGGHRIAGFSPAFGRRDLNPKDSYARDMFGSVCFAGLASQPGSARFPALTPGVLVSRTCGRCRNNIHAAVSTSNG